MSMTKVVIVGRPNVGKSSIFNWLAGRRLAIVDDLAGVTRDRLTHLIEVEDSFYEIVDTGGIGIADHDNLTALVEEQIAFGIAEADVILFVVDAQSGLAPLDQEVAKRLRGIDAPVICVANKCDSPKRDADIHEFFKLGYAEPIAVSTRADRGKEQLLKAIGLRLPEIPPEPQSEPEMKVAIVGRRNVGKSTFINTLVQAERMIVSPVPGTTRDSVDVRFELDGKTFVAIDTPGLRRPVSIRSDIDFYGMTRAKRSIRRADVVLVFFDAAEEIGRVDKQLVSLVAEHFKPCIFVVNKWDLLIPQRIPTEDWVKYLRDSFGSMWHVPIAFITGQTGKNVKTLLNHAQMLFKQSRERVSTGQLNGLLKKALHHNPPPLFHNRRPKIYYATQIGIQPPTIVMMCNQPRAFTPAYRRYLLGVFRDQLSFGEVPIKIYLHRRSRDDARDEMTA